MATEFIMPKLGLTMEQGTIAEWLVEDGAEVSQGAPVLRIETDKTETDVEAAASGRLRVDAQVGETYACGERIGWFLSGDETGPGAADPGAADEGDGSASASASGEPVGGEAEPEMRPGAASVDAPGAGTGAAPAGASPGSSATGEGSSGAATGGAEHVATTDDSGRVIASPMARRLARERDVDLRTVSGTGPGGRIVSEDLEGAAARTPTGPAPSGSPDAPAASAARTPAARADGEAASIDRSGLTPPTTIAARNLADLLGVDLRRIEVDPVDGRITRDLVARHVRELISEVVHRHADDDGPAGDATSSGSASDGSTSDASASRAPAPATSTGDAATSLPPATQEPTSTIPLTAMRGTIARRMHQSLSEMAQLSLFMDADVDAVVEDRSKRIAHGRAPSYTDYVIAAVARALRRHPLVNSQITDDGVALLPDVHVGMAVALDGGLVVPVVTDTADRDLETLGAETSRLAAAARDGALKLPELEGGTFSVSTLGMHGVDGFTPVINPPNTAILGVGRLRDDVVLADDGTVGTVTRLTLSLTWDHRAFDGVPAAAFCRTIVELLADPDALDATGDDVRGVG
ncbi:dihydrolipoamide acetyltransferase family protein [Ilumatobacter sp.]|uniref:dihydrolipoamide acetyltransferase family protein n=1 Tax=Ilumatobacter sp. TaxID=1967498 RepID=UPI003B51E80D